MPCLRVEIFDVDSWLVQHSPVVVAHDAERACSPQFDTLVGPGSVPYDIPRHQTVSYWSWRR
jgi:hypothetical protein